MTRLICLLLLLFCSPVLSQGMVIPAGANKHYQNEIFDAQGGSFAVKATSGKLRFTDCEFKGARDYLFDGNYSRNPTELLELTFDGCKFVGADICVRVRGNAVASILRSDVSKFLNYGVLVEGTEDFGPIVTVDGCNFRDPRPGKGGARQMIATKNETGVANIAVRFTNNTCVGPGEPFDRNSLTSIGTGDQLAFRRCRDLVVTGNYLTGGGENLICVESTLKGLVTYNRCDGWTDGHPIQISSRAEKSTNIVCKDNICENSNTGEKFAGIYVQGGDGISLEGNRINVSTGYGILIAESENIDLGPNQSNKPVQVFADTPIVVGVDRLTGPASVNSTADPIIDVQQDNVSLVGLTVTGRFKDDGVRQRGIYSDTANRGRITGCEFFGMTNAIKLDGVDSWQITDCHFHDIIGVKDGYGYGILSGVGRAHLIAGCVGTGSAGRGRHFVYLSAGASGCVVRDSVGSGWNSSTFAMYAKRDQSPCVGNTFERCTARNQLTGHDGTAGGAVDTGAFEFTGWTRDTTLRDCSARDIATNGLIVNTHGTDAEGVTVERFRQSGCKIGVFLVGAKRVRLVDSTIENGIAIHPWWRTAPKRATEDVEIVRTSGKVVINPTLPRPKRVTQDGKVLAP